MVENMSFAEFLVASNTTQEEWDISGAEWSILEEIRDDYEKLIPALVSSAENVASRVRDFPGVHSVRMRVKDKIHLLKKIVRKKYDLNKVLLADISAQQPSGNEGNDPDGIKVSKWLDVNVSNYLEVVTDLIGVRALHLFMDECVGIDDAIRDTWELVERPTAYLRTGDTLQAEILARGGTTDLHPFGYRSIHYIVKTRPEIREFRVEVQVRTIFQEGWSEIDHKIRYPDFSKNPQVAYFLDIFNVLAGSADSMGSFVKDLVKSATEYEQKIHLAQQASLDKDEIIAEMQSQLKSLKSNKTLKGNKEVMQAVTGVEDRLSRLSAAEKASWRVGSSALDSVAAQLGSLSVLASGEYGFQSKFDALVRQRAENGLGINAVEAYEQIARARKLAAGLGNLDAYEALKKATEN